LEVLISAFVLIVWVVWVIALYWVMHRSWMPTQGRAFKAVLDVVLPVADRPGRAGQRLAINGLPAAWKDWLCKPGWGWCSGLGTLAAGLAGWPYPGWLVGAAWMALLF
jgi:hypothetical protein